MAAEGGEIMTDHEKRAHDLAILYMQLEIKEGQIVVPIEEDYKGFFNEYQHLLQKFTEQLEPL